MSKRIDIQDDTDLEQAEANENSAGASSNGSDRSGEVQTESAQEGLLEDEPLEKSLEEAEQKANDYYDKLLRVSADFDNYKKRAAREMQELAKYANEKLIKEILTVVDNLERAIDSAAGHYDENDPLIQGVHLTLSETLKILDRHQVKPLTSLGQPFDPSFHQAMMQEEVQGQPPNTVVKELQKGYLIHDRLLRPALVAVSKTGGDVKQNNS
jgi:molecular chaperone GrpE